MFCAVGGTVGAAGVAAGVGAGVAGAADLAANLANKDCSCGATAAGAAAGVAAVGAAAGVDKPLNSPFKSDSVDNVAAVIGGVGLGGATGVVGHAMSVSNGILLIENIFSVSSFAFGSFSGICSGSGGICFALIYNLAIDCRSRAI